jgi:hypothetical protein
MVQPQRYPALPWPLLRGGGIRSGARASHCVSPRARNTPLAVRAELPNRKLAHMVRSRGAAGREQTLSSTQCVCRRTHGVAAWRLPCHDWGGNRTAENLLIACLCSPFGTGIVQPLKEGCAGSKLSASSSARHESASACPR